MALKSFVLEQFFVKKQSAEKNTAYSLPTPSGDDNNVLIKIYMYVFNCLPLKQISNDGQKNLPKVTWPYQSKQPLRQYCTLDKFLFFCRLINKNVLEWFLPVISKERTLKKSTNLGRNHLTLWFSFRREGQQMPNTIQIPITNFWAVTFSTYGIACLEFFRAFRKHPDSSRVTVCNIICVQRIYHKAFLNLSFLNIFFNKFFALEK